MFFGKDRPQSEGSRHAHLKIKSPPVSARKRVSRVSRDDVCLSQPLAFPRPKDLWKDAAIYCCNTKRANQYSIIYIPILRAG